MRGKVSGGNNTGGKYKVGDEIATSSLTREKFRLRIAGATDVRAIDTDTENEVYVASNDNKVRKIDELGNILWTYTVGFYVYEICVDSTHIYILHTSSTSPRCHVTKLLRSTGALVLTMNIASVFNADHTPVSFDVALNGDVMVVISADSSSHWLLGTYTKSAGAKLAATYIDSSSASVFSIGRLKSDGSELFILDGYYSRFRRYTPSTLNLANYVSGSYFNYVTKWERRSDLTNIVGWGGVANESSKGHKVMIPWSNFTATDSSFTLKFLDVAIPPHSADGILWYQPSLLGKWHKTYDIGDTVATEYMKLAAKSYGALTKSNDGNTVHIFKYVANYVISA